jgi:hypothetical protein
MSMPTVQPPGDHPHRGAGCHEFGMLVCHSCETTSVFKLLEPYIRHTVGEDTHVNHTGLCIRQTKRNPCKLVVSPAVTRTRPQIVSATKKDVGGVMCVWDKPQRHCGSKKRPSHCEVGIDMHIHTCVYRQVNELATVTLVINQTMPQG